MRIISGKWRGKQLIAPESLPVRPTTDRAKESLFNWLNFRIDMEGIDVLDLFAGTGNIGYEFLSRGAKRIVAVDENLACVKFMRQTYARLNASSVEVLHLEARKAIQRMYASFDIIFADPPYIYEDHRQIIVDIFEGGLLRPEGWLIIEHPAGFDATDMPGFYEMRKYGKVHFSYFQLPENDV